MKTANKLNPTIIKVTSYGKTIGTMTTKEFRDYMNSNDFTANLVKQFNDNKTRIGEPERVEQVLNAN